ncbi:hypothetical protein [Thalassotalea piscium]|uniref:Uncharacterized protein n=1 Tax=Thalassotalea piscium TaxID=1230533 RepID=A0A7X0NGU7_9GAMM|nr:hypothetical protein [Thalassotalea piscium]MBB6543113.1 hypothetical protein [Thalassotalea piscium]
MKIEASPVEFLWHGMFLMAGIMIVGYFVIEEFFPIGKNNERHWRFSEYYKKHPEEFKKH